MEIHTYLFIVLCFSLVINLYLVLKLLRVRQQLALINDVLADMKAGNLNRRVLVHENDMTKQICYDINRIAAESQARLIQQKQAEQSYKRLMTSLSHDVKTPLASLVGYLEAVENGLVVGREREAYIRIAAEKAQRLKEFVISLFEWVKLDAREQVFHFELADLHELSRSIVADWVPVLENNGLEYEIVIPETVCMILVDSAAYVRILNNLLQNIITHSGAAKIKLSVTEEPEWVSIALSDNGRGILPEELPYIFERMYQCDHSRSAEGTGLGLSIAKELVNGHGGRISVTSTPDIETTFTVLLPKVL